MSSNSGRSRSQQDRRVRVRWVRSPIVIPKGRKLRILIYARYSTAEQRRRSIKAQIEFCKKFIKELKVTDFKLTILTDEKLSGELYSRPGIDQVWSGIRQRNWDIILCEDASRPYRDEVHCVNLVRTAVDHGIRVFCIGDYVDTAELDWEERLKEAARFHAVHNRYCSNRIKRAHDELWDAGAAIGHLLSGYKRISTVAASSDGKAKGPHFDEVDPQWLPVIQELYQRAAAGESPWSIANRLTEVGLPKTANSHNKAWSDKNVIDLIRRTDYRGFQTYRDCVSTKEYASGKHKPKVNDADEILTRQMPHQRMVEDWLWYAANAAIDARAPNREFLRGRDNPQFGIPRDSRGPLAGIFFCSCGAKMHVNGHGLGGYRCSLIKSLKCWNKATANREKTHTRLREAILRELQMLGGRLDQLRAEAVSLLEDGRRWQARRATLEQKQFELTTRCKKLERAIELSKSPPDSLVARLEKRADRLARVSAQLERLKSQEKLCAPPTPDELHERWQKLVSAVTTMDRASRDELKLLVGAIHAIPYRQFGGNKVVLRAKFELRLAALLPTRVRVVLSRLLGDRLEERFGTIPVLVDLFEPSTGPRYGLAALALKEQEQLGLTAIGKRLGITKRQANLAVQYGTKLRDAGLTAPFVELTEAPANASRWRSRRQPPQAPNSDPPEALDRSA